MKETKRLISLVLCIAMVLTLAPAAVFATGSSLDIWVVASSTSVGVGDQIDYTVYAAGVNIPCMQFDLIMPEGLTYVAGSAAVPQETLGQLGWYAADWTEKTMRWSGFTMTDATSWSADTALLTFSCVAEAEGEYEVALENIVVCDADYNDISASVSVAIVMVGDTVPVVTDIPDIAADASMDLYVEASITLASVGDRIDYTVYAAGVNIACMEFTMVIPEGLTFVYGSGAIPAQTQGILGWDAADWTESSMKWTGYSICGTTWAADTALLTFSCVAEAEGDYEVQLSNLVVSDGDYNEVTASVSADLVTVGRTSSADEPLPPEEDCTAGHLFDGEWQTLTEVTCTTDGEQYRVCSRCGAEGTQTITEGLPSCTGSDYVDSMDRTFDTFSVPGAVKYVITLSDSSYLESNCDHLYAYASDADGALDLVDSCTGGIGGRVITVEAEAFALRMTTDGSVTNYGFEVASVQCFFEEGYQVVPATGHSYEAQVVDPTCTEGGYTQYTCSVCGDSYQDALVEALGHDLPEDGWTEIQAATCTQVAIDANTCLRCAQEQTRERLPLAHSFDGDWVTIKEAVCLEDGMQVKLCSVCGAQGSNTLTENLPSCTGSDYINGMNQVFPTFTVPHAEMLVLTFSAASELESGYDNLHIYSGDEVNAGKLIQSCTGSFGGLTVTIPGDTVTLRMTTDGSATRYGFEVVSVQCFFEEGYQVIPATGHSYEAQVVAPTCTTDGYTQYTCIACGDSYQDTFVEALGHDLPEDSWTEIQAATCTQVAIDVNTCGRCSQEQTRERPALGHSFTGDWTVIREAVCEIDGVQAKTCSVCGTLGYQALTEDLPSCTDSDYTNGMDQVFPTVTIPGAEMLILTFSADSELESGYDNLYVYSGNEVNSENQVDICTGDFGGMTVTVPGDAVTLRMTTDGSAVSYGFEVVSVEAYSAGGYEILPALAHEYSDWVTVLEPGCETWGREERTCGLCGKLEENDLGSLDHEYGEWETVQEPTCVAEGYQQQLCSRCGYANIEYISALGHDYVYSETIEPTCTTDGAEISICTRCGGESRKILPARHSDGDGDGFCDYCAEPFVGILDLVFVIDTTGSMGDEINVVKQNITNYANRLEESGIPYYIAVVDYRDFEDRGDSSDYPYSVVMDFSSNLEEILAGVDSLSLGYGGDTPETVYSGLMTGLDELSWGNGTIRRVILMGDAEPLDPEPYTDFTLEQVTEHLNEQGISLYAVTAGGGDEIPEFAYLAEQTGGASYSCYYDSDFEQVMTDVMDSIPQSVHIHTYEEFITEPTCTEYGLTTYVCTECGKEITAPIDPLGHDHSTEWTVDAEPTCTEDGSKSRHCSRCDHRADITAIEALGHDYSEWSRVQNPTCTGYGRDQRTCGRCNHVDTRSVAPLGHSYSAAVVEPTCTQQGYTVHRCTVCGYSYNDTIVPAKGHSYGDWIVDVAATVLSAGSRHRVCSACGYIENQTVAPLDIDINTNTNYGQAVFTVVNAQTLQPISGAQIFLSTENDGENTFTTDANGQVTVILPVGKQPVSAYAPGCLTRNLNVTIKPGVNELPQIGLSDKPTYEAQITSERMTLEEIEDAGIDTTDPSNQHVYKYELKLEFEAEVDIPSIITYFNGEGTYLGGHTGGGGGSIGGGTGGTGGGGGGTGGGGIRIPVKDDVITVYPVSEYFYLIIRGEVTWLKEMFDVEMLVVNNSMTDTLEDLTATLELPEGLSLAAMVGEEQTASQYIGQVAEGKSETVHWYVRGDRAGSYSLTAKLEGMVMPFEEPINDVFVAEDEIQIWAGNAMHLHFEFPDVAYHADDYPITITLTNVSDITLYNVNHMLQVEQGMEVYYSDGSSKVKIDRSSWNSVGVREFHPGDKIIIETTVNIFFESEVIEYQLQKLCDVVTGVEKLINAVKAVKSVIDIVDSFGSCINGCVKALDDFDFSVGDDKAKLKLFKELYGQISDLASSCATSGDETVDAAAGLANSGLNTALNAITSDPEEWLAEHSVEDIANLIKQVKALDDSVQNTASTSKKFNIFDSIRTAISAVPIRFVLTNVVMTEDENNTTSIPWSYSVTQAGPRYFGVSNVSKYLNSLMQAGMGEVYGEVVPWYWQLIPGLDDPFNAEEAIEYIQATEQEIAQFKAKDATGEVTFRAWVERSGNVGVAEQRAFNLSTDNENATYEDGVLTFTGDGTINVTPQDQTDGTLYIEDSEGNTYIYELDVIEKHECVAGEQQVVVAPTAENDGFAVKRCVTCDEILEIIPLAYEDCCEEHTFGDWTVTVEASCTESGLRIRTCTVCGAEEYQFDETSGHLCASWQTIAYATCSAEGTEQGTCQLCGNEVLRTIPKLPHTEGTWLETKAPSAFEEGTRSLHCAVCDTVMQTETIPMTQETFGYGEGEEKLLVGLPEKVTPEMLIAHYQNMGLDVTVTDAQGEPVTYVGTGCKVSFGDDVYTVLLMGDVNGDGILNVGDLSMIYARSRLLDIPMDEYQLLAADYNDDGLITVGDTAKLYAKIRFR